MPFGVRASHAPLNLYSMKERALLVLRLYDKIDPEKVHTELGKKKIQIFFLFNR